MRASLKSLIHGVLTKRARRFPIEQFSGNALVLAPHFDDEVLGCGGTIVHMLEAGLQVHVWFLTDGSQSHSHLISPSLLTEIRQAEGYRATAKLGINPENIRMFGYPDSRLAEKTDHACQTMVAEFLSLRPSLVFAPYHNDGPADHVACNVICEHLARQAAHPVTMLEYPIWAWHLWPWSEIQLRGRRELPLAAWRSILENFKVFKDWDSKVAVQRHKDRKLEALNQYESQMTRLIPTERWPTLAKIGSGSFLQNFTSDYEFFNTRTFS